MRTITTAELKSLQDDGKYFRLINVLPVVQFQETLIPGAQPIPLDEPNFTARVERAIGAKDRTVAVYCGSAECPASTNAGKELEAAGFTDVLVYRDGARGWREQNQQAAMNVGS